MATTEQIADLRRMVNEPTADTYADADLGSRIDTSGSLKAVAATIWTEKAAQYADLVDVQEGSSRRSLGKLHEQALAMASMYGEPDTTRRQSRTRQIERQ